ncbi:MAG: CHAD domain-containing protein [Pseudomonadota bacterium]
MAYAYLLDEDVADGTRRILSEEVDRAEKILRRKRNKVIAVHETRKSIKRARALLRLVKDGLQKRDFRRANTCFRDLNRLLAQSRDMDVMVQTLTRLEETCGLAGTATASRVHDAINAAREDAAKQVSTPPIKRALAALDDSRELVSELDVSGVSLDIVIKGLGRSMAEFTKHHARLSPEADAEVYHEWRKTVQFHRRHILLLSAAWPDSLQPRVSVSKQLSECLGFDHDLAVFMDFVSSPRGRPATKRDVTKLAGIASSQQVELRRQARALGALLSAEAPNAFRSRVEAYWQVQKGFQIELNASTPMEASL